MLINRRIPSSILVVAAVLSWSFAASHAQSLKQFRSVDAVPNDDGTIEVIDAAGKVRAARIDYS